jgi:hypothetical protein
MMMVMVMVSPRVDGVGNHGLWDSKRLHLRRLPRLLLTGELFAYFRVPASTCERIGRVVAESFEAWVGQVFVRRSRFGRRGCRKRPKTSRQKGES